MRHAFLIQGNCDEPISFGFDQNMIGKNSYKASIESLPGDEYIPAFAYRQMRHSSHFRSSSNTKPIRIFERIQSGRSKLPKSFV
jgi:hypothetical protein